MIFAFTRAAILGGEATAASGLTTVHLFNNTGNQALSIRIDGRAGCRAAPKGGECSFQAPIGFHHFSVAGNSGPAMDKALYLSADNAFVWTVEGKDLPGASRWSTASNDRLVCRMQLTVAGVARKVCASKADWDAENTRARQDMMVKQRAFCGGGAAC